MNIMKYVNSWKQNLYTLFKKKGFSAVHSQILPWIHMKKYIICHICDIFY